MVGKVFVLLWPSDRFRFLHRPETFADVPDASCGRRGLFNQTSTPCTRCRATFMS